MFLSASNSIHPVSQNGTRKKNTNPAAFGIGNNEGIKNIAYSKLRFFCFNIQRKTGIEKIKATYDMVWKSNVIG